jgi:hypothetical protein
MVMSRVWVLLSVVATACATADPLPTRGESFAATSDCDPRDCGDGNSPVIDGVYFWMLSWLGDKEENVQFDSARKGSHALSLHVENDKLVATDLNTMSPVVDDGLVGATLRVLVRDKPYQIRIAGVSPTWDMSTKFWAGSHLAIQTYELKYAPLIHPPGWPPEREVPGPEKPLCKPEDGSDTLLRAVIFTGDRYDPVNKTATAGPETIGWMNIACEGGAPYKTHLSGYTSAAMARMPAMPAKSPAQRTAMIKMWSMSACGKGKAFTTQGTPIAISDPTIGDPMAHFPGTSGYPLPDLLDPGAIEALWGESGALCLNSPRIPSGETTSVTEQKALIEDACGRLPPCDDWLRDPLSHGAYLVTGIP